MNFFKKIQEQRNNEMITTIRKILPANCALASFEYDKKYFGNMVVIINSPSKYYTFVTDRGEIYCNDKIICDGSYRYFEKEDTFPKLLSVIKSEMKCFFTFTHGFKYIQKLPEISFLFALHKQKSLTKPEKSGGVRLFCVFAVCLFLCNFVGFGVFFDVKMMSKFQSSKKRTRFKPSLVFAKPW